jgi:hypothetical protein
MGMPISMIFSIFLIIAFIATAIYVGTILLEGEEQVSIGLFYQNLQKKWITYEKHKKQKQHSK